MRVLVVGGGGREHAICRKLRESGRLSKLYCAPGNAGIAEVAELVPIGAMEFEKIRDFALREKIDLVVIGMDDPLIGGLADFLEEAGLKVFGPKKNAAILEGSKAFAKELMKKYEIPTAAYESFTDYEAAKRYLETCKIPVVLKADGPALGKGVLICETREAAEEGLREMMLERKFGASGDKVVIEEFMTGREVSVLSFVDGKSIRIMASAQDHKRAKDGDQGLNTGGMGNYSPSPYYTDEIARFCEEKIYQRTVDAMAAEGRPFQGVIFFGLMLTPDGPRVLEYNVRFGDPEAQVVLPRMENDLLEVMLACVEGKLDEVQLKFCDKACVTVVLASEGYPVKYEKGLPISGLESLKSEPDVYCYHAGTRFDDEGRVVTNGGRVLDVTALGKTIREARERAYAAAEKISFANKYMRTDIALAGVAAEEAQQA
jgi:phosphoribosylamine--glycine ligase